MKVWTDFPTKAAFRAAFAQSDQLVLAKSRSWLREPDLCVLSILDDRADVLVCGPGNIWRDRVEVTVSGKVSIFDPKSKYGGKRKLQRHRRKK